MSEVMYINKQNLKNSEDVECDGNIFLNFNAPASFLAKIWRNFNWKQAEETLLKLQCSLTKATFKHDKILMQKYQNKITTSTEARMLAVRKVSEELNSVAGFDGVRWRTDAQKVRAAMSLTCNRYHSTNYKHFKFEDKKAMKERHVGIPSLYDRAMHVLYSYALEPISEASADKRSFAYRKGRSTLQAQAFLLKALKDEECPDWILVADVKSYYHTISHEWILKNIPMNKKVLKEFIKIGMVFEDGEIFPVDQGISLGCSISGIIGNMTLDGIQKMFYDMQGKKITDYKNGWLLRFADDMVITARTKRDAYEFKEKLEDFLSERGLKLSDEKTKVVNIRQGFEFLSMFYYKNGGTVHCVPTEFSVKYLEQKLSEKILDNGMYTTRKLIQVVNQTLNGWASYYRVCEAKDAFRQIDTVTTALLLRYIKRTFPKQSEKQLIHTYWMKCQDGSRVFSLQDDRKVRVIKLEDTVLIDTKCIDLNKNVFLDKEYFDNLNDEVEIRNITGKYREVWKRQKGRCAICNRKISPYQERKIIRRNFSTKRAYTKDLLYIHSFCDESELVIIKKDNYDFKGKDAIDYVNDAKKIMEEHKKEKKKGGKFDKLTAYFHNYKRTTVKLKFAKIEKIIGCKLCASAYKRKSYFYNHTEKTAIANSWTSQGYKIVNIDMEKQEITFEKDTANKPRVIIPDYIYKKNLPVDAKYKIENFLENVKNEFKL